MAGQARQQGNRPAPQPTTSGHGWQRPGYITMPYAANDNRLTARRLLGQRRFWVWSALILALAAASLLQG